MKLTVMRGFDMEQIVKMEVNFSELFSGFSHDEACMAREILLYYTISRQVDQGSIQISCEENRIIATIRVKTDNPDPVAAACLAKSALDEVLPDVRNELLMISKVALAILPLLVKKSNSS